MIEKHLGKITKAEFGQIPDRDFLFGLQLTFAFDGKGCSDGGRYTVNICDECKWEFPSERSKAFEKLADEVNRILTDAKCHYVSELAGKPVEVTVTNNCFDNFRILTEVL